MLLCFLTIFLVPACLEKLDQLFSFIFSLDLRLSFVAPLLYQFNFVHVSITWQFNFILSSNVRFRPVWHEGFVCQFRGKMRGFWKTGRSK